MLDVEIFTLDKCDLLLGLWDVSHFTPGVFDLGNKIANYFVEVVLSLGANSHIILRKEAVHEVRSFVIERQDRPSLLSWPSRTIHSPSIYLPHT